MIVYLNLVDFDCSQLILLKHHQIRKIKTSQISVKKIKTKCF